MLTSPRTVGKALTAATLLLAAGLMAGWGLSSSAPAFAVEPPPIFDTRPYTDAKAAAEEQKRWFIVKATAEWCAPCKRMDKTTWRDESVAKALKDKAVVVALDVDKDPDTAKALKVEVMPTMIAFRDGKEFDRVSGYQSAAELTKWFAGLERGEKAVDALKRKAEPPAQPGKAQNPPGKPGKVDVDAKMELARALLNKGDYSAAADEYVWLWQNILKHQPSMYGVRLSFMAGEMERAASKDADARKKFLTLRGEAWAALDGANAKPDHAVDWVVLNRVVGEKDKTLEWYGTVKGDAKKRPLVERVARDLRILLIEKNRWAEAGALYTDPLQALETAEFIRSSTPAPAVPPDLDEQTAKRIADLANRGLREEAGTIYAAVLAAGRDAEAAKVAAEARKLDPSQEMLAALILTALKADKPLDTHLKWIDAVAKPTDALKAAREAVTDALAKAAKRRG
jgi:thioredoxin 1